MKQHSSVSSNPRYFPYPSPSKSSRRASALPSPRRVLRSSRLPGVLPALDVCTLIQRRTNAFKPGVLAHLCAVISSFDPRNSSTVAPRATSRAHRNPYDVDVRLPRASSPNDSSAISTDVTGLSFSSSSVSVSSSRVVARRDASPPFFSFVSLARRFHDRNAREASSATTPSTSVIERESSRAPSDVSPPPSRARRRMPRARMCR